MLKQKKNAYLLYIGSRRQEGSESKKKEYSTVTLKELDNQQVTFKMEPQRLDVRYLNKYDIFKDKDIVQTSMRIDDKRHAGHDWRIR